MAAFSILLGTKSDKQEVITIDDPRTVNDQFKDLVLSGGDGFDKIEVVTSRAGRTKRKRFKGKAVAAKKVPKKKAANHAE